MGSSPIAGIILQEIEMLYNSISIFVYDTKITPANKAAGVTPSNRQNKGTSSHNYGHSFSNRSKQSKVAK